MGQWGDGGVARTEGSTAWGLVAQLATFAWSCDHCETRAATAAKHPLRQSWSLNFRAKRNKNLLSTRTTAAAPRQGGSLSIHLFFCHRFSCSQGRRSARAHPGCLRVKAGFHHGRVYSLQRPLGGTLTYSPVRVSNQHLVHVCALWTLEKLNRSHTDTETTERPRVRIKPATLWSEDDSANRCTAVSPWFLLGSIIYKRNKRQSVILSGGRVQSNWFACLYFSMREGGGDKSPFVPVSNNFNLWDCWRRGITSHHSHVDAQHVNAPPCAMLLNDHTLCVSPEPEPVSFLWSSTLRSLPTVPHGKHFTSQ